MIYIQLDENGEIKGLYGSPQPQSDGSCLTEPEPVNENDPRVLEFIKKWENN